MTLRLRTAIVLLVGTALLAVAAVVGPLPTASASPYLLSSVNAERRAAGAAPLTRAGDMDAVAQAWSNHMAATGKLQHNPSFSKQVGNWQALAENVGYGGDEAQVHRALMASAGHRKNILNSQYREIGIGLARSGSRVWITQIFRRPLVAHKATAPAMSSAQASAYVTKVYSDLLGRRPDASGQKQWTNELMYRSPRQSVANAITASAEFRSKLIGESYQEFLGRGADPAGRQHWLRMMSAGWTVQDMESGFISSPEFYGKSGGTNAGWVRNLYRTVLERQASSSEVAHWVSVLQRGAGRRQVALGFLLSSEDLGVTVDGYYRWLLHRGIDPVGRTSWVRSIQRGARVEQIIGGIIASPEYFSAR